MGERILIGFAEALAAIEVAGSLRNADYDVYLFSRETSLTALSWGYFGRRCEQVIAPQDDVEASLAELAQFWQRLGRPAVFPLDDDAVWLVRKLAEQHQDLAIVGATGPLADLALDKGQQLDVARAAGFQTPYTCPGEQTGDGDFPCFIKGQWAAELRSGRLVRTSARLIDDGPSLRAFLDSAAGSPILSQPHIEGVGEGVFGIARDGHLLVASGHRRVRMMNPQGSGSSACEARMVENEELIRTRRFVEICRWHGLFMLEFLRDKTGTSWFMELNGRPWGSLALARSQSLDYPRWAVDLALKDLDPPASPGEHALPQIDVESRHLGREIVHLAFLLRQGWQRDKSARAFFASLGQMIRPKRKVNYYNLRPVGWRVFLWDVLFTLARHSKKTHLGRLLTLPDRVSRRWRRVRMQNNEPNLRNDLHNGLAAAKMIAVVCFGNINRSAVGAILLARALPPEVRVLSCGLHRRSDRPADPVMTGIAANSCIDLSGHRSKIFTSVTADEADVILVMERWHRVWMEDRYPQTRGKVFLMGLIDDGALEIPDPFEQSPDVYASVFRRMVALADAVARSRPAVSKAAERSP